MSGAVIAIGSRRFELVPGDAFTFGRSPDCTVCLDASDTGISRLAGSVGYDGSSWWLTNRSGKRSRAQRAMSMNDASRRRTSVIRSTVLGRPAWVGAYAFAVTAFLRGDPLPFAFRPGWIP